MFFGYNTNGLAHHRLSDAVELLAEIGYEGVAITIDHNALSPYGARREIGRLKRQLHKLGMRSTIETGAPFLLDPRRKHEPTFLSTDRRRRIEFYKYAVDCAAEMESDCVSLWSGRLTEPLSEEQAMTRLCEGLSEVLDYAAQKGVVISFEPEPGMLIDTLAAFERLLRCCDAPNLRLTLDIGHVHCQDELPLETAVRRWAPRLANVHLDDMRRGVHEHLMFGEGEIDFPPILHALKEIGYAGGGYVELNRHSREGPAAARAALEFLRSLKI